MIQYFVTLTGAQKNHHRKLFSTINKLLSPTLFSGDPELRFTSHSWISSRNLEGVYKDGGCLQAAVDALHPSAGTLGARRVSPDSMFHFVFFAPV